MKDMFEFQSFGSSESNIVWHSARLALLLSIVFFAACGDSDGGSSPASNMESAETLEDLPNCTESRDGEMAKIESEKAVYRCENGKWEKSHVIVDTLASVDDLMACVSKREGDSAYIAEDHSLYRCNDGIWMKSITFMDTVSTEDKLPNCNSNNEGDSSYVKKEKSVYLCVSEKWHNLGGVVESADDLPNCTAKRDGEHALVKDENVALICSEGRWLRYDIDKFFEPTSSSSLTLSSSSSVPASAEQGRSKPAEGSSSSKPSSSSGESAGKSSDSKVLSSSSKKSETASSSSLSQLSSSSKLSSSSSKPAEVSSSSQKRELSSSSVKVQSSSSKVPEPVEGSSSSKMMSSSSKKQESSSSRKVSSSSVTPKSSSLADGSDWDGNVLKDLRDGKTYRTVTIGGRVWMAENLNFETKTSKCFKDDTSNCAKYGRYYVWSDAMDSVAKWSLYSNKSGYGNTNSVAYPTRGICPKGWHMPDPGEWSDLFSLVGEGDTTTISNKLKSTSGWHNNYNGTDDYGFTALPAGYWSSYERSITDGKFVWEGEVASFWTNFRHDNEKAYYAFLEDYSYVTGTLPASKTDRRTIRCLMDYEYVF